MPTPMKPALVRALIPCMALLLPAMVHAGEVSVARDAAPVFQSMSASSAVVATLKKGDTVSFLFSIGHTSGAWCRVAVAQPPVFGYMPCESLDLATGTQSDQSRSSAPSTPSPRQLNPESRPSPDVEGAPDTDAETASIMLNKYNAAFWARQLRFSDDQMNQLRELARRTGVTQCRKAVAEWNRKYRLDGAPGGDPADDFERAMREIPPLARRMRCDLAGFWSAFPRIMTLEQRQEFERWQQERDVPIWTRHPLDPSLDWFE